MGKDIVKPKHTKKKMSDSLKIFLETEIFAGIIYSVILFALGAVCVSIDLPKDKTFYVSACGFAICSFLTGFFAGFKLHKNGIAVGIIHGLPMNILILFISVILSRSSVDFTMLITFVILIITSMLGGITAVNTKKKNKAVKRRGK